MQARIVQVAIWLTLVAAAYVALLVGEQSSMISYDAWAKAQIAAFLCIGLLDWAYSIVGRAIMARRTTPTSRTSGVAGRTAFLVSSAYVPTWLVTMLGMGVAALLALLVNYPWFFHLPASTIIIACLVAPPVLRSRHWGAARFKKDGISVRWDDGFVTRLKWSALPDLLFLHGKVSETCEMPSFPRSREFRLVGADRRPGMDVARRLWGQAHAAAADTDGGAEG